MSCRLVAVVGLLGLLLIAGCGDDGSTTSTVGSTSLPAPTVTTAANVAPTTTPSGPTMVTSAPVPISTAPEGGATTSNEAATSTSVLRPTTSAAGSSSPSTPGATIAGSTTPTDAGLVMRANGLGSVVFGADPDTAIAAVTAVLGPPTLDSGWMDPLSLGSCPGTEVRSVQWGDLALHFGDESTVTTGRRHFFAYVDGPPAGATIVPAGLMIDGGGSVGTTVAALRGGHPAVQIYPADPTAPASFAISDGLTGVLTGTTDADTVTKVQGGIGCGE